MIRVLVSVRGPSARAMRITRVDSQSSARIGRLFDGQRTNVYIIYTEVVNIARCIDI